MTMEVESLTGKDPSKNKQLMLGEDKSQQFISLNCF